MLTAIYIPNTEHLTHTSHISGRQTLSFQLMTLITPSRHLAVPSRKGRLGTNVAPWRLAVISSLIKEVEES
jgi:hypothetical protein